EAAAQLLEMLDQGHRGSRSVAGASDGADGGTSFIDFLNSLSALPSALPISGRRRGPKIKSAIIPTMNNSGQWNPRVLSLRLLVGVAVRVRAGQPAAQARILGKLGPQPLEHGAGFGLAPEGVEGVGREPAAAEAQPRIIRGRPEPSEAFEGTCGVVPSLEQRLRGPHLDRRISREAPRGNLEQTRTVPGTACLFVELGLPKEAGQEKPGDVLGIDTADADAPGVPVHELAADLAGLEDAEEREQAEPGGHERHRPDDWAPAKCGRQEPEPPDEKDDVPCPLPPLLVRTHYGSNTGRRRDCPGR